MSYQLKVSPKKMAGAHLISKVAKSLRKIYVKKQKGTRLTQQEIARRLDVDRATINRRLLGKENMTLRTIAEMAWAMEHEVDVSFVDVVDLRVTNGRIGTSIYYNVGLPSPKSCEQQPAPSATPQSSKNVQFTISRV